MEKVLHRGEGKSRRRNYPVPGSVKEPSGIDVFFILSRPQAEVIGTLLKSRNKRVKYEKYRRARAGLYPVMGVVPR